MRIVRGFSRSPGTSVTTNIGAAHDLPRPAQEVLREAGSREPVSGCPGAAGPGRGRGRRPAGATSGRCACASRAAAGRSWRGAAARGPAAARASARSRRNCARRRRRSASRSSSRSRGVPRSGPRSGTALGLAPRPVPRSVPEDGVSWKSRSGTVSPPSVRPSRLPPLGRFDARERVERASGRLARRGDAAPTGPGYCGGHASPRRRPPPGRPQAHHAARPAHRLRDLPPSRRRAGHPARLRGHARRAHRTGRHPDAGHADHRRQALPPAPAGGADPACRSRHARRHGPAAADRRGGLPRHGAQRGDAAGLHLRHPHAGRPLGAPGVRPGPDAGHRRHAGRRHPGADQRAAPTTSRPWCCWRPPRASR
ncbi:hypothetical protein STENM223S_09700 [Streptomyces tendae]